MTPNELLKLKSPTLAGTIALTLLDPQAVQFSPDDALYLKFHGIYPQDDRDVRKSGKRPILMVRCRIPGGTLSAAQYLAIDDLATLYANNTLRVTSRQGLQFHGVLKGNIRALIKSINATLVTTLAACGDNNRNVMAPPAPASGGIADQVRRHASEVAAALAPQTPAYHAIWIDEVQIPLNEDFTDPLYGKTYLPRKFKVAFAIPPVNDVDIFTNCCGFIAIVDAGGQLLGYNLLAGGGMGRGHGNKATFPRLADVIGFLPAERAVDVARAVLTVHRDFGDRNSRKHARLKYVLEEKGAAWFRGELEGRLGWALDPARPFQFETQSDLFGWHAQADGRLSLGLFVETGRIQGEFKKALRRVIAEYQPAIRLTPANNVILCDVAPDHRAGIDAVLAGLDRGSVLRRASMACVALPTCSYAVAESERFLPQLMGRIETALQEAGLPDQEIHIRMTGCPNGCARPYMAEIAFVGKAPGVYQMWLGGNVASTRLNRLYRDAVKDADIIGVLGPLFERFAKERQPAEAFGDWAARAVEYP